MNQINTLINKKIILEIETLDKHETAKKINEFLVKQKETMGYSWIKI